MTPTTFARQALRPLAVGIAALLVGAGCTVYHTMLDVAITEHPSGGYNVSEVRCAVSVYTRDDRTGGDEEMFEQLEETVLHVQWYRDTTMVREQTYVFGEGDVEETRTIRETYAAPSGQYLKGVYWAYVFWKDFNGMHNLMTTRAECGVTN